MRVGFGMDAHRFGDAGVTLLGGVVADDTRGVIATSDGDVLAHALTDALLGAAGLGDIGMHFPSSDEESAGADSMELLARAVELVDEAGYRAQSVDVTVVAQSVRVEPIREDIRSSLASVLGMAAASVSVKATTTDGMGFTGRDEGLAALAVAVLVEG